MRKGGSVSELPGWWIRDYTAAGRPKKPKEHGTYHCYRHYDCRCEACREAARLYRLELKNKEKPLFDPDFLKIPKGDAL